MTQKNIKKITKNITIKDLIQKSGNSFHFEVAKYLKSKEWEVLISPYYTDNITEKPREIDLIAEKAFEIHDIFGKFIGTVNIQLLIECKYVDATTIFWFDKIDKKKLFAKLIDISKIQDQQTIDKEALVKALMPEHHYIKDEAAKLFYTNKKQNIEQDIIYKALNQCLNSVVYFRKGGSIIKSSRDPKHMVRYPVILCRNKDHFYNATTEKLITEDFLLEVNYAYLDNKRVSQEEYFLVDVVNFENLENFLKNIEDGESARFKEFVYQWLDRLQEEQSNDNNE